MKTKLLSLGLLAALPLSATADLLSIEVAAGNWEHDPSGTFQSGTGGTDIDLTGDFRFNEEEEGYTYAVFRHAVPLVPNIKVMNTSISHQGTNPNLSLTFDGTTYAAGQIDSDITLDHTDITAFWNMVDTGFTFDLGLTARQLDGEASVDDTNGNNVNGKTTTTIDGTIPMLYAGLAISPIDNLRFSYEVNWIGAGDSNFTDSIAKISYHTDFMLGIEVGVRDMNIELDDQDGNFANMDFSGSFIGVSFKF